MVELAAPMGTMSHGVEKVSFIVQVYFDAKVVAVSIHLKSVMELSTVLMVMMRGVLLNASLHVFVKIL